MRKTEVKAIFNFSYAELIQLGDQTGKLIKRDISVLADYGVDEAIKQWIADKTMQLKDFSTDEELEGEVTDATEIKDSLADEVKVMIRSIMVRVKNKFGEKSGKYRMFGIKGMNELNDENLFRCGKRVIRVAGKFLSDLASKGLTQAHIDDFAVKNKAFDDAIDDKDEVVRSRDNLTEDRLELANVLYEEIVNINDYGKDYWITKNEAKYNDYVLNDRGDDTSPEPDPAPEL